jgi:membrane protein
MSLEEAVDGASERVDDVQAKAQDKAQETVREKVPGPLRRLADRVRRHQTLTLAAGLAFFGLVSFAPALGLGMALMRLVTSPQALDALVEALKDGVGATLSLGDLLDQMEGQAGRYAGLSLLVVLWPATTLASGWTRALDAVNEDDATPVLRGLWGRVRGLGVGLFMTTVLVGVVASIGYGTAVGADRLVGVVVAGVAAVGLLFVFCLLVYRWLPSASRPWRSLTRGAAWATAGVVVATLGLVLLLTVVGQIDDRYPPALSTALVLGLWLYAANVCLLLGDELNNLDRPLDGDGHD